MGGNRETAHVRQARHSASAQPMSASHSTGSAVNMRIDQTLGLVLHQHGPDLSYGSSSEATPAPPGHCARFDFRGSGHSPSTVLRPVAPPALPGFDATMDALTPEWSALRGPRPAQRRQRYPPELRPASHPGLPVSRVWPSKQSVSNHLTAPCRRFHTQPLSATGFPGFALLGQARRSARPNRVRHPTDCPFVSSCSPPPLTRTQLLLTTGRSVHA